MSANDKQVGGGHYRSKIQHWDYVHANNLDYFQAQITKYVTRWRDKNGVEDLKKAQHFLEKYIELESASQPMGQVNQDRPDEINEAIPAWVDVQGAVGTVPGRYVYRCIECKFRATAHGWKEFASLHGEAHHATD